MGTHVKDHNGVKIELDADGTFVAYVDDPKSRSGTRLLRRGKLTDLERALDARTGFSGVTAYEIRMPYSVDAKPRPHSIVSIGTRGYATTFKRADGGFEKGVLYLIDDPARLAQIEKAAAVLSDAFVELNRLVRVLPQLSPQSFKERKTAAIAAEKEGKS